MTRRTLPLATVLLGLLLILGLRGPAAAAEDDDLARELPRIKPLDGAAQAKPLDGAPQAKFLDGGAPQAKFLDGSAPTAPVDDAAPAKRLRGRRAATRGESSAEETRRKAS